MKERLDVKLTESGQAYYPIFYMNDFWMLSEKLQQINSSVTYAALLCGNK